ncbi:MAG: ABC transporter permease [Verrucomicrobiota bacterium]
MYPILTVVGSWTLRITYMLGDATLFGARALFLSLGPRFSLAKISHQIYQIGVRCIPVILLVSIFTGLVLGLQGYHTLSQFGTEGLVGSAVALSLVRELGPVLTALMVIGQAGSTMAAELGMMRSSEQIDALETMDIPPLSFLVGPRLIAGMICFPLLTSIFNIVGIYGGYLATVVMLDIDSGTYWYRVIDSIDLNAVIGGYSKSLLFAANSLMICCYMGYNLHKHGGLHGAQGVNTAATTAVVLSSISTLILDYLVTAWML